MHILGTLGPMGGSVPSLATGRQLCLTPGITQGECYLNFDSRMHCKVKLGIKMKPKSKIPNKDGPEPNRTEPNRTEPNQTEYPYTKHHCAKYKCTERQR